MISAIPDDAPDGPPLLHLEGTRAVITLNRPRVHNRLELDDLPKLGALLQRVEQYPEARVLLLTGRGQTFGSGFDLNALGDTTELDQFAALGDAIENLRVPSVCALNGPVYGGATDLALACDFRIGLPGCRTFVPVARLGIQFYGSGLRRFVERLGLHAAKRLLLAGATLEEAELRRIGFLDEVVEPAALATRSGMLCDQLAANAPLAVQGMKRCLDRVARGQFDATAARADMLACLSSEDFQEGLAALRARRAPVFRGR